MLSLPNNSVLALRISLSDDTGEISDGANGTKESGSLWIPDGCDEGTPMRCLSHIPVPGMLMFLYTPLGPTLTLNGAVPRVALSPRAVRFSLTPGRNLNVLRNRQLITSPSVLFSSAYTKVMPTKTDTSGSQLKSVLL
jgi:hypothetical protein